MASTVTLSLFFLVFFFSIDDGTSQFLCKTSSCGGLSPAVRFPFRLKNTTDPRCGYQPDFDLYCDDKNKSILSLPFSRDFSVESINYKLQILLINDPNKCLPRRLLEAPLDLRNSPFQILNGLEEFVFLNCSYPLEPLFHHGFRKINCMSDENYTVLIMATRDYSTVFPALPAPCPVMMTRMIPLNGRGVEEGMVLKWSEPDCESCEARGGDCGLKSNSTADIQCFNLPKSGLPRGAKYGLIIGVGIPGLLFLTGLGCYICGKFKACTRPNNPNTALSVSMGHRPTYNAVGLDGPTIESFPKTLLGESRRLPKPNDNTCSICLSEYQPKETIRTIPECSHYFHANCVDEWLKLNGTCPVCRNSPEDSSMTTTPLSSVSMSSTTSLS